MTVKNLPTPASFGHLEVLPAAAEEIPIVANLFELYAHDFSEFHPVEPGPDGRFTYPDLPLYWSEAGRHPFLIKVDGKLAGFALIRKLSLVSDGDAVWDVAEFFVLRAYRRQAIGKQAAHALWRQFPGHWEVRVMQSNRAAHSFWRCAIEELGGAMNSTRVEKAGETWNVFSFESPLHRP